MVSNLAVAAVFLKIGALGFGGPYSLLAMMQREVVERRKWVTAEDFAQSVAIGTMTPGPIFFAAAVYVGYRLRGLGGAVTAAVACLLPSFLLSVAFAAVYVQVEAAGPMLAAVKGVSAAVVGVLGAVTLQMGRSLLKKTAEVGFAVACLVLLAALGVHPLLVLAAVAILGPFVLERFGPKADRQLAGGTGK